MISLGMDKHIIVSGKTISERIFFIRHHRVMIDADLAILYGVTTKALNQAVKRNIERFPEDFMFQLTQEEKDKLVTNCDHLAKLRYAASLPYAFTEQGVAMLSSILKSKKAIQVNIQIMRIFTRIREFMISHKGLQDKIEALEKKYGRHEKQIQMIFEAIKQLLVPVVKPKPPIGFKM